MKNWKTTTAGMAAGAMYLFSQSYQTGMTFKAWVGAAGIALVGILAKDFNVTGGSVPATTEAQKRV